MMPQSINETTAGCPVAMGHGRQSRSGRSTALVESAAFGGVPLDGTLAECPGTGFTTTCLRPYAFEAQQDPREMA